MTIFETFFSKHIIYYNLNTLLMIYQFYDLFEVYVLQDPRSKDIL